MPKPSADQRTGPMRKDAGKLKTIHERYAYGVDRKKKLVEQRKEDMRHVSGDPWEPKEKLARKNAMRPTPACDELGQYENQVVNEVRANPRAIRFSPVGFGANDKTATFYGDKTREIEYRSHAQQHYTRAFQNMVEGSYGYVKLRAEYITDQPGSSAKGFSAFDQRLVIDGIPDPDVIVEDPDFLDRTGRDWKWLFELETMSLSEFRKAFKGAEIQTFSPELVKSSKGWITGSGQNMTLQVASYWEVQTTEKTLNAWQGRDPQSGQTLVYELFDDETELSDKIRKFGFEIVNKRPVDDPQVCRYRTNGVEILKKDEWLGKWIPYVACYGKMLYLDLGTGPELVIQSMTRLARVPNMLLAYYLACEAELIGMTPKTRHYVLKGTLDKKNAIKMQKANFEPVPFIEFDMPQVAGGTGVDWRPMDVTWEPPIQAIEVAKESARRAIQAAMGMTPLPTNMQKDSNRLSGRAMDKFDASSQQGSYHFKDSYDMLIERVGELIEDALPKYYDAAGMTATLDAQKRPQSVFINAEKVPQGAVMPDGQAVPDDALPNIEGLHAVTIDVGPADASARQQSSDFVDIFVQSPIFQLLPPPQAMEILALMIKLKNLGPIGEEIAEVLHPSDQEQGMVPVQKLQEAIQLGEQMKAMLMSKIQEYEQEKQAKVVDNQAKAAISADNNQTKRDIAAAEVDKDVQIQRMRDDIEMLKLHITNEAKTADREAGIATEGAKLEHATAMTERGHQESAREGRESRTAVSQEAARERESRSQEAREQRASADRNAAEDRKVKVQTAKKPSTTKGR